MDSAAIARLILKINAAENMEELRGAYFVAQREALIDGDPRIIAAVSEAKDSRRIELRSAIWKAGAAEREARIAQLRKALKNPKGKQ